MAEFQGTAGADTITPNTVSAGVTADPVNSKPSAAEDYVYGWLGADIINTGGGNDTIEWWAGDGNDDINGGSGTDTLDVKGFGAAVSIRADGGDALVQRDTETVRIDNVERIRLNMDGGGEESVRIEDLSGTDVKKVGVDFGADFDEDHVEIHGTGGDDQIDIVNAGTGLNIDGLAADIKLRHFDEFDSLTVKGFGGDDRIDASSVEDAPQVMLDGGNGKDELRGGDNEDWLFGGKHADFLAGGKGGDFLWGDRGADQMKGGSGGDTFAFSDEVEKGKADTILDFKSGIDFIGLANDLFDPIGGSLDADEFRKGTEAQDANDFFIYHKSTGRLFFDADGSGNEDKVLMAKLDPGTTLKFDDIGFIAI